MQSLLGISNTSGQTFTVINGSKTTTILSGTDNQGYTIPVDFGLSDGVLIQNANATPDNHRSVHIYSNLGLSPCIIRIGNDAQTNTPDFDLVVIMYNNPPGTANASKNSVLGTYSLNGGPPQNITSNNFTISGSGSRSVERQPSSGVNTTGLTILILTIIILLLVWWIYSNNSKQTL